MMKLNIAWCITLPVPHANDPIDSPINNTVTQLAIDINVTRKEKKENSIRIKVNIKIKIIMKRKNENHNQY